MGQPRHRIGALEVSDILPLIDKSPKAEMHYLGNRIKLHSLRLQTFKFKGCVCVRCGLIGTKFIVERDMYHKKMINEGPYHINLYGYTIHGTERLFTKDHILARANGGRDQLSNMQTMCENCNRKKAHYDEFDLVDLHWENYLPPYNVRERL